MTSISTRFPVAYAQEIDTGKLKEADIRELSGTEYRQFIIDALEARYNKLPDTANHAAYQPYATVEVNGRVVARIDNHGWAQMSNSLGARLSAQLPGEIDGQTGPVLAQKRAEIIAEALGGEVVNAPTALTQSAFDALRPPGITVDQTAMQADPLYQILQKTKQIESQFRAQQIAREGEAGAASPAAATDTAASAEEEASAVAEGKSDAVEAFMEYMAKTPEERYFEAFLNSKGMTEEAFQALPPAEQQALLKEFEQYVKRQVGDASAERLARAARSGLF